MRLKTKLKRGQYKIRAWYKVFLECSGGTYKCSIVLVKMKENLYSLPKCMSVHLMLPGSHSMTWEQHQLYGAQHWFEITYQQMLVVSQRYIVQ